MCDWRRELSASQELFPSTAAAAEAAEHRALADMLGTKGEAGLDALFTLRDFMLQEALNVVKFA